MNKLIAPTKHLGYSDFFRDFLAGTGSARKFFLAHDFGAVAAEIEQREYPRRKMVEILRRQNSLYGVDDLSRQNAELLADTRSIAVVAGQQAGLMSNAMLSLLKAFGVVKRAKQLSQDLGRPVIPIFWIAADDHDFAEINHTWMVDRAGALARVAYEPGALPHLPVGALSLSDHDAYQEFRIQVHQVVGESDFTPELYEAIEQSYAMGENIATAFGKLMAKLTAGTGLVFFNPFDDEVKRLAVPLFTQIVENQDANHERTVAANDELLAAGYHLQVEKHSDALLLFYTEEARLPITGTGSGYRIGERTFDRAELLRLIEEFPERFSTDVFTRPILQSWLFPTVCQLGGPSEIAYLAQINHLFPLYHLPAPVHVQRPFATLIEKRFERLLEEHHLNVEDILGDIEPVITRVLLKSFPEDVEERYLKVKADIAARFDEFTASSLQFDPTLTDFAKQTAGKVDFALNAFEAKLFASHKKKSKDLRERFYRMQTVLYPHHTLQERTINVSYFLARYGFAILSFLYERLDAQETAHQVISLSDY